MCGFLLEPFLILMLLLYMDGLMIVTILQDTRLRLYLLLNEYVVWRYSIAARELVELKCLFPLFSFLL